MIYEVNYPNYEMTPNDFCGLIYDMITRDATKEEFNTAINGYLDYREALKKLDPIKTKYKYREPLDGMTVEDRCRWFSEELLSLCGNTPGSTEWEEALIFADAADEIKTSNGIIESQLFLIQELQRRLVDKYNKELNK